MATFGEVLKQFKESEEAENIAPLVEDAQLRQAIMAWPAVRIDFEPLSDCPHEDEAQRWRWLWDQVKFESKDFGVVAGVPPHQAAQTIQRLAGLRLIYPDGTVHVLARQYLRAIIMSKLKQPNPRGRPKNS